MTAADETRGELLEAMAALHEARNALVAGDTAKASTQLDKAAAIIAEIKKKIP